MIGDFLPATASVLDRRADLPATLHAPGIHTVSAAEPPVAKDLPILENARTASAMSLPAQIRAVRDSSGANAGAIVRSWARLAFGPGKLSFDDYVRLRLFDESFIGSADRSAFVGQRRNLRLCHEVNYRHDWFATFSNKVAANSYLAAFGCPIIPTEAIFAPGMPARDRRVLVDRTGLEHFLSDVGNYPMFAKPIEGYQSLGSVQLTAFLSDSRELVLGDGRRVTLERFSDEVTDGRWRGYLFQRLAVPHDDIAALCGDRLATVRFVTIVGEDGPRIFRAALKIPGGGNVADNFWRPGNLLAQIDLESGLIGKVVSGSGLETAECPRHPDTGAQLEGAVHPQWDAMRSLALDGARMLRDLPFIGWDIACTREGPVVVDMNETPDLFLVQFADRRGVLDTQFEAFIAYQRKCAIAHRKAG